MMRARNASQSGEVESNTMWPTNSDKEEEGRGIPSKPNVNDRRGDVEDHETVEQDRGEFKKLKVLCRKE